MDILSQILSNLRPCTVDGENVFGAWMYEDFLGEVLYTTTDPEEGRAQVEHVANHLQHRYTDLEEDQLWGLVSFIYKKLSDPERWRSLALSEAFLNLPWRRRVPLLLFLSRMKTPKGFWEGMAACCPHLYTPFWVIEVAGQGEPLEALLLLPKVASDAPGQMFHLMVHEVFSRLWDMPFDQTMVMIGEVRSQCVEGLQSYLDSEIDFFRRMQEDR